MKDVWVELQGKLRLREPKFEKQTHEVSFVRKVKTPDLLTFQNVYQHIMEMVF